MQLVTELANTTEELGNRVEGEDLEHGPVILENINYLLLFTCLLDYTMDQVHFL